MTMGKDGSQIETRWGLLVSGAYEVRWRSGQETSLAPPCSNHQGILGANVLYWKTYLRHCRDFTAPGHCAPLGRPLLGISHH